MNIDQIIIKIENTCNSFDSLTPPPTQGVYAVFIDDVAILNPRFITKNSIIYLGKSSNLAARDLDHHFGTEYTGFSTLRRSLGALLKNQLNLTAYPRSSGSSPTNVRNYRFQPEGERRLSSWMIEHLQVGYCPLDRDPSTVEKALIQRLRPPLNLTNWPNPNKQMMTRLRNACRAEAETNRGKQF